MDKFIFYKDNVLSDNECDDIIKISNKSLTSLKNHHYREYEYCDIENTDLSLMKKIVLLSNNIIKDYIKKYPELNLTGDQFALTSCRFKKFKKDKSFKNWHSEHCKEFPTRILNIMYYLSDHNCGTEFYNGSVIKSVKGRSIIFPSYFTHTHRGQVCPDKKTRYILTGYFNFI